MTTFKNNLFIQFMILSLVVLTSVGVAIDLILSDVVQSNAIEGVIDETIATNSHRIMSILTPADLETPMVGERYAQFQEYVQNYIVSDRTARVKIWDKNNTVIYSSDANLVGKSFPNDENVLKALSGKNIGEIPSNEELEDEGQEASETLIEVYTPIVFTGINPTQGVLEIYEYYQPTANLISLLRRNLVISLSSGFAVLYALLVMGVWKGWKSILAYRKEREVSAQALKESEEFNSALLENSPNPVIVYNTDSSVKYVNPAFELLTGFSRKEVMGLKGPYPWCPQDMIDQCESESTSKDDINLQERCYRKKNGESIWISFSVRNVREDDGKIKFHLGNWVDITPLKRMENTLRDLYEKEKVARQTLEEESNARGLFINVLAHELRTPLTSMLPCTIMLKENTPPETPSVQIRLIDVICKSSHALAQRLEELLEVAKYSRGTFKLKLQSVDLKEFFPGAIANFKPISDPNRHELITSLPKNLPVIKIDTLRLELVIKNLLSNAANYSPPGGKIYLEVTVNEALLRVDIKDEGAGISPEDQKNLFKPYHMAEQDRKLPGLGLGLTICKQIIEAHGGKIWAFSEKGKGSTFSFAIPSVACEDSPEPIVLLKTLVETQK
jgi:PAS domain S-box-containing protein